jgi:predicted helicase
MSTVAALQQRIADVGIDLVSCDSEGQLIAIQHKCYAPTATLRALFRSPQLGGASLT